MPTARVIPGSTSSPVILHVPHASRHIPAAVRRTILLTDPDLATELDRMTDTATDLLAEQAAHHAATRPWIVQNTVSRLVVDPERFPDEREEMRKVGMGAVYTRTSHGTPLRHPDPATEQALLNDYFHPYADTVSRVVTDRLAATGTAVLLDVHSYPRLPLPYELHPSGTRPAICLGTDPAHTPPHLLAAAQAALAPCGDLSLNTPFAGCYVPLHHYNTNPDVTALMIEIRRDIYLTEPAGPPTPALNDVVAALTRLINEAPARPEPNPARPATAERHGWWSPHPRCTRPDHRDRS
ncbi:N-formylglutamate amidohydrolase [Nocardia sp. alder85J]|uniref:N-formylglutamate amidohydrolase n=1 Tax=Nocardia sp. alder85J TaxID=2862949 RepID=UPI001CD2C8D9|nr:N-formylglutamate amidohydrolase [Nocardia sp. alder85J]MCX4092690.1 N-formylglutamate amidohydrolase [Nocardia sp. alder85J]